MWARRSGGCESSSRSAACADPRSDARPAPHPLLTRPGSVSRQATAPAILFLDELEAIVGSREAAGGGDEVRPRVRSLDAASRRTSARLP